MRLSVRHETSYAFDPPMRAVQQSLRLMPSLFEGQTVIDWAVDVPGAVRGAALRDAAGDWIETTTVLGPVEQVTITVEGTVETVDLSGLLKGLKERVPPLAYLRETPPTRPDLAIAALAEEAGADGMAPLELAHALSDAVADAISYTPGATEAGTTAAEALARGAGVCQDHAHVLISAARLRGLPARYASGYLFAGEETPHEASHAWAEIHIEDLGWVGFDPANRVCPDEKYIRLGSGLDAVDGAPIRGVAKGEGTETLDVHVAIEATQQ